MTETTSDPASVRDEVVAALELDLVGPGQGHALEAEKLSQSPSRWYLTGFLVPIEASEVQRVDETVTEEVEAAGESGGVDDDVPAEPPAARRAFLPSSMGLSLLVASGTSTLNVTARWGDYTPEERSDEGDSEGESGPGTANGPRRVWQRAQRSFELSVQIADGTSEHPLEGSGGMAVVVTVRPVGQRVTSEGGLDPGTRSVSVFLVNRRKPAEDEVRDRAFAFQAELEVECEAGFVRRPDLRGLTSDDWDERVADLQYRDVGEYAVGHGVSAQTIDDQGACRSVRTVWVPRADVERVASEQLPGVVLGMETLSSLADASAARSALEPIVDGYRSWLKSQKDALDGSLSQRRRETADELLHRAGVAADRIEAGVRHLDDPVVLDAFRIANRAMAASARRRFAREQGTTPDAVGEPEWRPFQIAFILLNLRGIVDPAHADREVVDLLFFPTGGGKTEAYLGLSAFTLVYRRLCNSGIASSGVTVLMRYTLRLLTLDQLSRAAALICALELERQADQDKLGNWPFEVGLWVGQAATPNRMGRKGDNDQYSARAKTIAFKNDTRKPSPIPIEECPWCGTKFGANSFELYPDADAPIDLRVRCVDRSCDFTRDRWLPVLGVDEPIYRRLPCFLIATVDKFAAMPWTGQVGAFFGKVDRFDGDGFYGPCDPGRGSPLQEELLPPELIIQDELHLIAGPMGTMVGLYETALETLSTRDVEGRLVRPKIVASTATVRRAQRQIQGLFGRIEVEVFPPPGPDRRLSYFARTHAVRESNARLYVGVAAQGRSPKVIMLRTYLALLGAAQKAYEAAGGKKSAPNPVDPYMTLVGYFNSLRELGGARRIVEDEVASRLAAYSNRKRVGEVDGSFADRKISTDVVELTSRVSTDKVADAKRRLALVFGEKERVDVAIATNMISVGLDITRLGLMVVYGQPKTTAEYIQATSRVGRDHTRPGLVVTLLNTHKPRDRSHYERFAAFHEGFYRSVEATGVTPFSPRALDRGLAGTVVALGRHGNDLLTPPLGAGAIRSERGKLAWISDIVATRARRHAHLQQADAAALEANARARIGDLLDEWTQIALDYDKDGIQLQYQEEVGAAKRLLYEFLNPELKNLSPRHLKFRANRSMRDVESEVGLWMRTLDDREVEGAEVP